MTDRRPHIVVVEDEAAQRHLLVEYLGRHNFRVTGVDGGRHCAGSSSVNCRLLSCSTLASPARMGSCSQGGCANAVGGLASSW